MAENRRGEERSTICCCPYCDAELVEQTAPFCRMCGVTLRRCPSCLRVVEKDAVACPSCGQRLD